MSHAETACEKVRGLGFTHRPLSSSFLGLPYRIQNKSHKKELLRGLWVFRPLDYMGTRSLAVCMHCAECCFHGIPWQAKLPILIQGLGLRA